MAERVDLTRKPHHDMESCQEKPRLTIRQLREAAQKETLAKESARAGKKSPENQPKGAASGVVPQKKKASIFGGLFQVREPTSVALNQVAAQMIAQHGSTSATKVPNVRLEKMPDYVPKVNSKWDGIPESVKQREKKEKEREKQNAKAESFFSADSKTGGYSERRRRSSRNSSSTTGSSLGAFPNSSDSQSGSSRTRLYAQSVNSSGDLVSQQRADASVFSRSPTSQPAGKSIPEESFQTGLSQSSGVGQHFGPRNDVGLDTPKPPAANQLQSVRPRSTKSWGSDTSGPPRPSILNKTLEDQRYSKDRTLAWESIDWAKAARSYAAPPSQSISQQPASLASSQGRYLVTTSRHQARGVGTGTNELSLHAMLSEGPDEAGLSVARKKDSQTRITDSDAFLAGEARELFLVEESSGYHKTGTFPADRACTPGAVDGGRNRIQQDLQQRPDSSRERLGLRASMLFADEVTPWEMKEPAKLPSPSLKPEQRGPNTSQRFQKSFGKLGK
ncbi:hypothetical protein A1O7_10173 [Cladophialophora yegresii CBS 114405]|uniref:Uncharacterized protein n=1 Tax=Cladophialophora yegresii CBS 114405 TaxID=1182544 RepID=W9VGU9_9EURO|nr:uncharacterized protein A1O7_10173 [Cladophialophora yegresii CBS 114405]EXJ54832.1 hypothetical protein A1O7_10173 [Cladophialophora yegresii CBS 114405]